MGNFYLWWFSYLWRRRFSLYGDSTWAKYLRWWWKERALLLYGDSTWAKYLLTRPVMRVAAWVSRSCQAGHHLFTSSTTSTRNTNSSSASILTSTTTKNYSKLPHIYINCSRLLFTTSIIPATNATNNFHFPKKNTYISTSSILNSTSATTSSYCVWLLDF